MVRGCWSRVADGSADGQGGELDALVVAEPGRVKGSLVCAVEEPGGADVEVVVAVAEAGEASQRVVDVRVGAAAHVDVSIVADDEGEPETREPWGELGEVGADLVEGDGEDDTEVV